MSRRGGSSYIEDDRREYVSRGPRSRYDDRDYHDGYHRDRGPPREREREREVRVREQVIERERPARDDRDGPAFLREDYGRSEAGPMVLLKRETEEFDLVRPPRPASPEPEKRVEKEEIIIRQREESEHRAPPARTKEKVIEKEEIIIRRREDDDDTRSVARSHRGGVDREKEEIIITRRTEEDDRHSRRGGRSEVGRHDSRPISHERERGGQSDSEEIIIRSEDRGRGNKEQEIIIRHRSRSNSPSSASRSGRDYGPIGQTAPPIHREVIYHHRDVYHEPVVERSRPISRPPSPPSPPRPRERSEERIEIRRSGERDGEHFSEDIIIDRHEGGGTVRARSPRPPSHAGSHYGDYERPRPGPPPGPPPGALMPYRPGAYDRDEAEYYDNIARQRSYPGEAYHGATQDWGIVDVPPGTRRVRMDGQGGGEQEITWQRYNGVRRSRFLPDGRGDGYYAGELDRPRPLPGALAPPQYARPREPTDGLWTEITKDLVLKEAIKEMGYEYEETDDFYYIISYLRYEDVARLVGLSDDIRKQRGQRAREMRWENRAGPPPMIEPRPRPAIEGPPRPKWDHEDDRYIEREVIYRGGRPPGPPPGYPPPGYRRP